MDGFALIMGGGGSLGRDAALAFAEAGVAGIVLADLNADAADSVAQETQSLATHPGFKSTTFSFNITNETEVTAAVAFAMQTFGRIDYAVNAVGIELGGNQPFSSHRIADFDAVHAVNTRGLVLSLQAEIRAMAQQPPRIHKSRRSPAGRDIGRGAIVNIVSAAGVACRPGDMVYTVSKHAGMAVTKMAALDHARDGLRINAVCPTWVRSAMVDKVCAEQPEVLGMVREVVPWKRMAEPEEVADAVVFLCGPASSYVNGSYLLLDCGATLSGRASS